MNKSGLHPRGRAVLLKPYEPDLEQGTIVIPDSVRAGMRTLDQRAIVIEVGKDCWLDETEPRAVPGDKVLVARYSGAMAEGTLDKQQYRFVNDRDIYAVIED